ncbi:MAG: D-glycero-beta-D-manno-heptose 1-phosphate adenylyltransferase [Chitinophagales bacterium]
MNLQQIKNKIFTLEEFQSTLIFWHFKDEKIVFTNGCFDLLHQGHLHSLTTAKSFGTKLIVGVNSDSSVKRLKGESRPIKNENERALMLAAYSFIDAVIIFEEDTPKNLIETISPNVLAKGGDYQIENIVGADFVLKNGGTVEVIPLIDGFSTTSTIDRMGK